MLISEAILERAGIEVRGQWDEWLPPVVIDSREVSDGALFWALAGEHVHGHDFVEQAYRAGAAIAAVGRDWSAASSLPEDKVLFVMEDTLEGLQALAREVRRSLGCLTLGITGSNGKTTTRELLAAALNRAGATAKARANHNNHIGLPLTILNVGGDERFLVLELGANHMGEISALAEIGHPEIGLITNIGDAHLGEFGGFEQLKRAKGELFDHLAAHDGLAVVNLDDPAVLEVSAPAKRRVGYTLRQQPPEGWVDTLYMGRVVELDRWSRATLEVEGERVALRLPGQHWASAALGAFAAAVEAGVDARPALEALAGVEPLPGRGRVVELGEGCELLDDAYNANSASIEAAVRSLGARPGPRFALLGDMLELGSYEEEEHRRLGRMPELEELDRVWLVGDRMGWAADEAEAMGHTGVTHVPADQVEGLAERVLAELEPDTGIVVKGSRRIGLDRVVNEIEAKRSGAREQ